jgi:hypothetical protein
VVAVAAVVRVVAAGVNNSHEREHDWN